MDYCEGFKDWVRCLRCEDLCTNRCPLEREGAAGDEGVWRPRKPFEVSAKKQGRVHGGTA